METVKIRAVQQPDGLYIEVSKDGMTDLVGPVTPGTEHTAILEGQTFDLRESAKTLRKHSQKSEQRLATLMGGRVQKASGALPGYKGDVKVKGVYHFEHKFTQKSSRTLSLFELDKTLSECGAGEAPVFVIEFVEPAVLRIKETFYVVRESAWVTLNQLAGRAGSCKPK